MSLSDSSKLAPSIWSNEDFRDVFEASLGFFKNSASTQVASVELYKSTVYKGMLFDYLNTTNTPKELHWFIMRLNDMSNPDEFGPQHTTLLIPSDVDLDKLRVQYNTTVSLSR
jgi:hypothetical protein